MTMISYRELERADYQSAVDAMERDELKVGIRLPGCAREDVTANEIKHLKATIIDIETELTALSR